MSHVVETTRGQLLEGRQTLESIYRLIHTLNHEQLTQLVWSLRMSDIRQGSIPVPATDGYAELAEALEYHQLMAGIAGLKTHYPVAAYILQILALDSTVRISKSWGRNQTIDTATPLTKS